MDKKNRKSQQHSNHLDLDLLNFVSHELKTPLSTLKLNVEVLKSSVSHKEKRLIEIMDEEVEWMIQFISDTLELRKISSNKAVLKVNRHKWGVWFQTIQNSMEKKATLFGRTLKIKPAKLETEVYMDTFYIKQALSNLIMNAVNYSPKGGTIEVSWEQQEAEHLQVRVEDEGPGINLKDKEKIFEAFYKDREYLNQTIKASGLGLAIVKKIIQAHGGEVSADNRPNQKGAVFVFTLPRIKTEPEN